MKKVPIGTAPKTEAHLLWAPSSQGKTFLIDQTAAELKPDIYYHVCNLAKYSEKQLVDELSGVATRANPSLILIDEADSRADERWPLERILYFMNGPVQSPVVFVFAGSSESSLNELKQSFARRWKGPDFVNRIDYGHEIPPSDTVGDTILAFASRVVDEANNRGIDIAEVERLALFRVATDPALTNPRTAAKLGEQTAARLVLGRDWVEYDDLFESGDQARYAFRRQQRAESLATGYVSLRP